MESSLPGAKSSHRKPKKTFSMGKFSPRAGNTGCLVPRSSHRKSNNRFSMGNFSASVVPPDCQLAESSHRNNRNAFPMGSLHTVADNPNCLAAKTSHRSTKTTIPMGKTSANPAKPPSQIKSLYIVLKKKRTSYKNFAKKMKKFKKKERMAAILTSILLFERFI